MTDWRDTHQRQETRPGGIGGTINCAPFCAHCHVPWPCPTAAHAEPEPDNDSATPPVS
jgi:hypothetical protein